MRVVWERLSHSEQRYDTCGDWVFRHNGDLIIRVSILEDFRSELAVALHETVEALLCRRKGITTADVDAFDMAHPELDDPGNSPLAPYHIEHKVATVIEQIACKVMGIEWSDHDAIVSGPPMHARGAGVIFSIDLDKLGDQRL